MWQIRFLIACGALKPGDQLPSVRELAVKMRINPNTVVRTYRDLQQEKIIGGKWGEGNFVSGEIPELARREKELILAEQVHKLCEMAEKFGFSCDEIVKLLNKTEI